MNTNLSRNRSTAKVAGKLEPSVTAALASMLGREPLGLLAAGIDPGALALALLGTGSVNFSELISVDPATIFPEAAKRKVAEDEDEGDDDDSDDEVDDDEEEDEEVEEDEDLDEEEEDEDEEDEEDDDEDEDEDEEEDEFDDPDDDDDYDDDDEDDFDDDE